jgi:hypothetical protein
MKNSTVREQQVTPSHHSTLAERVVWYEVQRWTEIEHHERDHGTWVPARNNRGDIITSTTELMARHLLQGEREQHPSETYRIIALLDD